MSILKWGGGGLQTQYLAKTKKSSNLFEPKLILQNHEFLFFIYLKSVIENKKETRLDEDFPKLMI